MTACVERHATKVASSHVCDLRQLALPGWMRTGRRAVCRRLKTANPHDEDTRFARDDLSQLFVRPAAF